MFIDCLRHVLFKYHNVSEMTGPSYITLCANNIISNLHLYELLTYLAVPITVSVYPNLNV